MSQSLPLLRQEFLQAQSANVQTVSGATYTSQAFEQSLQSALAKAVMATAAVPGVRRVEHVMGMPIVVDVRDDGVDEAALDDLFAWLRRVDATFSTYQEDSEIRRLGRGELALGDADPDVREVLDRCEELRVETDGFFDANASGCPRPVRAREGLGGRPRRRDPRGRRACATSRSTPAATSSSRAARSRTTDWRVGIEHPRAARPRRGRRRDPRRRDRDLRRRTRAATTSSTRTRAGRPRASSRSRSPARTSATADAYATAAFAMGLAGPAWTARLRGYEALTILADGRVLSTPGFPARTDRPRRRHRATGPRCASPSSRRRSALELGRVRGPVSETP